MSAVLQLGAPLNQARTAVLLLHGRGSSGQDIAGLAGALPSDGVAYLAPSAPRGSWYPERFLAPLSRNEPWLSEALGLVAGLLERLAREGVPPERTGLVGFSQGACLALEYAARHPRRYGFVGGLSGALIGPADAPARAGDLAGTPVLLECAELDPHIPLPFVEKSAVELAAMGAVVTKRIHPGAGHAIFPEGIDWIGERLRK